jgi:hypothetical protein
MQLDPNPIFKPPSQYNNCYSMGCSVNCTDIFQHLYTLLGQVHPQYQAILCYFAAARAV